MTISERQNAATFIQYTTVKPFIYRSANYKCFYCKKTYPDVRVALLHVVVHDPPERSVLLKKYLHKGKRVVKVDISGLQCRICELKYSELDAIKQHLSTAHKKEFNSASNGLIPYNLTTHDGKYACHKCKKTFNTFFLLNLHMNEHFNVVCETCGLGFMSNQRLINHQAVHEDGSYPCDQCSEIFPSKVKLRYHTDKKHPKNNVYKRKTPLKCTECPERFAEHYKKMSHLKQVHGISFTFECQSCKAVYSTRRALTEHTVKTHTQNIRCDMCGKCFGTNSMLKLHVRSHTNERSFYCSICNKGYMHERTLRSHMHVHKTSGFKCQECGREFTVKNDYDRHMKVHKDSRWTELSKSESLSTSIWQMTLPERRNAALFIVHSTARPFTFMGSTFRCFYCASYHSDVSQLMEHTDTHTITDIELILEKYIPKGKRTLQVDISNLKCRKCLKNFENLNDIRTHLAKLHHVEFYKASNGMTEYMLLITNGMFSCHICSEKFHNFSLLNTHMNSHYSKVVCEMCGTGFLNQHLLLKHKETHSSKKLSCNFCEKAFVKRSQLKYHISLIHKGKHRATPNKCPHCDETFKEHYKKMLHLREIHGIAKNFPCYLCKTNFQTRRAVTEHINKCHTQKFKCEVCLKCFSIESKLRIHIRSHNGERNYVCPVCKNAYMHKMTLRKHMRTHGLDGS